MTNDYGKSKQDAISAIDHIKNKMKFEDARREGLSPLETAKKILEGVDMEVFGKQIKTMSAIESFYNFIPGMKGNHREWKAINNYAYLVQGYVDHPNAIEFGKFIEHSQTLKDVLDRILQWEEISLDTYLTYIPRLNKEEFLAYIEKELIMDFLVITGNQQEQIVEHQKALDAIAKSHEEVLAAENLHKTLMKDD